MEAPEEATPVATTGTTGGGAAATTTTTTATATANAPQKSVPYLDVIPLLYIKNHSRG